MIYIDCYWFSLILITCISFGILSSVIIWVAVLLKRNEIGSCFNKPNETHPQSQMDGVS